MNKIFTEIYDKSLWDNNNNPEYNGGSGHGSQLKYNINSYIPFIKHFIQVNNISSVVDLGCGDFVSGPYIYKDLNVTYSGYDVYKPVIDYHNKVYSDDDKYNFICLDIFSNRKDIVNADLCIIKDVLMHWDVNSINMFLRDIISMGKFKYILLCNCCDQQEDNTNIEIGLWRPLSCDFNPLKKFNPVKICHINSNKLKEISIITTEKFGFMRVNNEYMNSFPPVQPGQHRFRRYKIKGR